MKVFISADMEGISGVAYRGLLSDESREYERARKLMTGDVNAAIEGAIEAGAEEILVNDSHAEMQNLIPEELHEKALLIRGSPKPLSMMEGIDESFDGVFFIGYHSRRGTRLGFTEHSFSSSIVSDIRINGQSFGEIGVNSALAGSFGVPVVLVSGDKAATEEALSLLKVVEVVAVKEAVSRTAAKGLHPSIAARLIRESAAKALKDIGKFTPFVVQTPVKVEIEFLNAGMADAAETAPGVERVDGRRTLFAAQDFLTAYRALETMLALAWSILPRRSSG